jgi:hypothetical protein
MKLKNEKLYAFLFFTFAIVLSLGIGEIAIRLISDRFMIYSLEMFKYGKELKMHDPEGELSHVHRPNSTSHLMGVDITLNSMGNRSRELSDPKPAGEYRVYVAGSSIVLGWGVPEKNTFTSLTESRLNHESGSNYNFINAGVGNYGTFASTTLLYRRFEKVKPDMVILTYFIADIEPWAIKYNPFVQHLFLGAYLYSDIEGVFFKRKYANLFEYYDNLYQDSSEPWKNVKSNVLQLSKYLAAKNVPLLVVIVPDLHNLSNGTPYAALYAKMQSAFEGMNIPTINTFSQFQKEYSGKESMLWIKANDPHPNSAGHKVISDVLYEFFSKKNTLDKSK